MVQSSNTVTIKHTSYILAGDWHLHQAADDSQIRIGITVSDAAGVVQSFTACISDINDRMRTSSLRLNPTKTQVTLLGSSQQVIPVLST